MSSYSDNPMDADYQTSGAHGYRPRRDDAPDAVGHRDTYYRDYDGDQHECYRDDYDDGYYDDDRRGQPGDGDYDDDGYNDDHYYDDDNDDDRGYDEGDFFEDDFDEDERERKARERARNKRKPTKVYEVEDSIVRDEDPDDEDDPDNANVPRRDYWGRERRNCCDCFRLCCLSCCRGFRTPPACEPRRICECPHGWCYTVMGVVLGISGLVMCSFYIISCDIERITILYNGAKPPNAPRIGYGFISRGVTYEEIPTYMGCISYTDEEKAGLFDVWMHSARFFLFFSTMLGVIGSVVLFTAICVAWSPNTFEHWLMWTYVVAGLTVPLSYLLFGSPLCADNECKFGQGGVQCISIFLFWLCCANTVKSFPMALPPRKDEDDGGYNGEEEDDDDLYYETEEDMWNDRRPPKQQQKYNDDGDMVSYHSEDPYTMDPQFVDGYRDGEGKDESSPSDGYYDDRNENGFDRYSDGTASQPPHHFSNDDGYNNSSRPPHDCSDDHDGGAVATATRPPRVGDADGPTIT